MHDSKLHITDEMIVTDKGSQVMMTWETPLMKEHADFVCQGNDDILELGFGMGISASYIQANKPSSHTIIEIHPMIYLNALEWASDKPNVKILFGDWFDFFKDSALDKFDGIFMDTHHEKHYSSLPKLVSKHLRANGRFTFYNGNAKPLNNLGMKLEWKQISIDPPKNNYFNSKIYYMPTYIRK